MNKRVLHIIDTTGPGGAETVFLNLCQYSKDHFEKTVAVVRGPGWVMSQLESMGVDFREIDCKGSFNTKYLKALVSLIRDEQITLIQTHLFGSAVYGAIAGYITKVPVVSTIHGMVDISERERFLGAKLFFLRLAKSSLVGVTDQIREHFNSFTLINKDRVYTFYNGIDSQTFQFVDAGNSQRLPKNSNDELVIGSLGNIRKPKNYPLAIEVMAKLKDRGVIARFLIAGQGNDKQFAPLRDLVERYQLSSQVEFLGFVEDTPAYLSSLDVFLMSSSSEGHPLALTQAMSVGVPIVTTPSGVEQVVNHRETALISQDHDAEQLATLVIEIIENKQLKTSLINAAKSLVNSRFSTEAMTKNYANLYGKVVG